MYICIYTTYINIYIYIYIYIPTRAAQDEAQNESLALLRGWRNTVGNLIEILWLEL